jgi:hypothetical protein
MGAINHLKFFIMYSDDITTDVYHLHIKRIHLMSFSYIVIEDACRCNLLLGRMWSVHLPWN